MGVAIGDYDHSGGWSIFVTNFSNEYNALYKHEKAFQFTDASSGRSQPKPITRSLAGERTFGPALNELSVSRGSAAGDLDNDGDLDVVINNLDGAPKVLRNDGGNRGNFLVIDLEGRTGDRSAVGAIVVVRAGDLVQRAERRSGDSYLSHSDARLHFGLGSRTKIDSIEVRWPNGAVQRYGETRANTFIKIVEGSPAPQTIRHEGSRYR
jgi:enediyne biosynthesis protein E4